MTDIAPHRKPEKTYVLWSVDKRRFLHDLSTWKLWLMARDKKLCLDAMNVLRIEEMVYARLTSDTLLNPDTDEECRVFFITKLDSTYLYVIEVCVDYKPDYHVSITGDVALRSLKNRLEEQYGWRVHVNITKSVHKQLNTKVDYMIREGKVEALDQKHNRLWDLQFIVSKFKDTQYKHNNKLQYLSMVVKYMIRHALPVEAYLNIHPLNDFTHLLCAFYDRADTALRNEREKWVDYVFESM